MAFGAKAVNDSHKDWPIPRLGGLTITTSGLSSASRPVAKLVESNAVNSTLSKPIVCAEIFAQVIASAEISMPVKAISFDAQCKPKPPTPQNRSHNELAEGG